MYQPANLPQTDGKFLSLERWNPQVSTIYEETVKTDDSFRDTLDKYLNLPKGQRPTYPEMESMFGIGIGGLRGLAEGRNQYAEIGSYNKIANELKLDTEIDPNNVIVKGQYVAMITSHYLDKQGILGDAGVRKIRDDLASVDSDISDKLTTREGIANVSQRVRDLLTRAGGNLPLILFQRYEQEVIKAYELVDITRETLMEIFSGPISTLESRLDRILHPLGTKKNPKEYGYNNGFTPSDYDKGDYIMHKSQKWRDHGLGEVINKRPSIGTAKSLQFSHIITVHFESGKEQDFAVNPRTKV